MSIFISVVSHGHSELIQSLSCISKLANNYTVIVKLNKTERGLVEYLSSCNVKYIDKNYGLGFGSNNNIVYSYCKNCLGMKDEDFFIVFNPDVISNVKDIANLICLMTEERKKIATVNLYKDKNFSISDDSIRNFPTLMQFTKSFLGLGNTSILDKTKIVNQVTVDWAAGSFLAFSASHYELLSGFDENYFMYCEDIDICYRSKQLGFPVTFYPEIKMQHLAEHANRSILSKHFYWHVSSVIRFLLTRKGLTKAKSSLFNSFK